MKTYSTTWLLALLAGLAAWAVEARAQNGSLLSQSMVDRDGQVVADAPLTLERTSFLYQPVPPEAQREVRRNDIITVLVDYRTVMNSDGMSQVRKTGNFNAALVEWLGFDGKDIFAAPQERGDPTIGGQLNSNMRAQTQLDTADALIFRIAATVVDIRPNGNLVIEAHRRVTNNEEVWLQSLTGVVARQFVMPDRTVRSDHIAELTIDKREMGQVRDSMSRGWIGKWYGKYKPF
jgi:flagellar L-ring protein precursor FlgH